jgi:hypothetical protein
VAVALEGVVGGEDELLALLEVDLVGAISEESGTNLRSLRV